MSDARASDPAEPPLRPVSAFVEGPGLIAVGDASGPLGGRTFVAKDVFDVAGRATGAGNPAWRHDHPVASRHAAAVARLLDAGADLVGRVATDELAWSLSGTNAHYGTPANPAAPGRAPGGSSSGSAVAVADGTADLGLGTDTGGSIRVPASYCGVTGIRPTHGMVSTAGMLPLAPSFDTVGLLARSATTLRVGWAAIDPGFAGRGRSACRRLALAIDALSSCDPDVAASVAGAARRVAAALDLELVEQPLHPDANPSRWAAAFRVLQGAEAWATHGAWLTSREPPLGPGVTDRVRFASTITPEDVAGAVAVRDEVGAALEAACADDTIVLLPATPTAAHPLHLGTAARSDLRARTLICTAPAGLAGAPSVALPLAEDANGLPVGVCMLGPPGDDALLLDFAVDVERAHGADGHDDHD